MKLPFDFGTKLIFRLVLPGLILGIATAPLIFAFAHLIRVDVDQLEILVLGTLFWGWIITLADMPIYMLYEGRRFWPKRLRDLGLTRERRRLASIQRNVTPELARSDRRRYLENSIELLESVRKVYVGLQSFRSMRRIDARRMNVNAFRVRFSQSLAKRRQRLSQAKVRSTTHRLGRTLNPSA